MSRKKGPETTAITIRFPKDLWEDVARLALADDRSLNGEVVYLLRVGIANRTEVFSEARD